MRNQGTKKGGRERVAQAVYRFLERVDGERGLKLVPYAVAQRLKILTIESLLGEGGD